MMHHYNIKSIQIVQLRQRYHPLLMYSLSHVDKVRFDDREYGATESIMYQDNKNAGLLQNSRDGSKRNHKGIRTFHSISK